MVSKKEWEVMIVGLGGKIEGGAIGAGHIDFSTNPLWEFLDVSWLYFKLGDENKKAFRDVTASEMRNDGWEVKTETNSRGFFLRAKRRKK